MTATSSLPVSVIAVLQKRDKPFIYLARYSDHTYALKREAVRRRRPQIVALGGSRMQIGGPTGAFVVIVAGIIAQHGLPGLLMIALMAGVLLLPLRGVASVKQCSSFPAR